MAYLKSPETVIWEITDKCNLKCKHCNVIPGSQNLELSFKELKYIADMLIKNNIFKLSITGGEPLLHSDFFKLLEYLISHNIIPFILSNGILIDDSKIDKLKSIGIEEIQISLDGAVAYKHENIRNQSGIFRKTIKNCKKIVKNGIALYLNTVITKENINDVNDLINLALDLGATSIRFVDAVPVSEYLLKNTLKANELFELVSFLIKKQQELSNQLLIQLPCTKFIHSKNYNNLLRIIGDDKNSLYCEAGTVMCTITANGNIIPCTYFRDEKYVAGNLFVNDLEEIWRNSTVLKYFRNIGNMPSTCINCELVKMCRGGCRAISLYEKKNIAAKDPRCWR